MSRRKDRERVAALKRLNPQYRGFRGPDSLPSHSILEPVVCVRCGRKRNVPFSIAREQRDTYVCLACREG